MTQKCSHQTLNAGQRNLVIPEPSACLMKIKLLSVRAASTQTYHHTRFTAPQTHLIWAGVRNDRKDKGNLFSCLVDLKLRCRRSPTSLYYSRKSTCPREQRPLFASICHIVVPGFLQGTERCSGSFTMYLCITLSGS